MTSQPPTLGGPMAKVALSGSLRQSICLDFHRKFSSQSLLANSQVEHVEYGDIKKKQKSTRQKGEVIIGDPKDDDRVTKVCLPTMWFGSEGSIEGYRTDGWRRWNGVTANYWL